MNRYRFTCAGGAADVATRLDNAGQAGPLHVAPEHMLAAILPDAFDKTLAPPNVVVFIADINGLILGGMLFGDDMIDLGVHWAWAHEPLAAIFQALDQTNMDKTPIKGKFDIAYPIAVERFTTAIKTMTAAARTINRVHLMFDGSDNLAGTSTWLDFVKPALFASLGDDGPKIFAQFMSMMHYGMKNDATDGRRSPTFKAFLTQVEASVGRVISHLDGRSQAAIIVTWLKKTQPKPEALTPYIHDPTLEIERRASPKETERFTPLFDVGYLHAYPTLASLWINPESSPSTKAR